MQNMQNRVDALERLTIENFQSHRKSVIEPAPAGQLTVIIGPSDSGKSAVIRSLRLLAYNEPDGMDYLRIGASFVRVTAEYESGHVAIRERMKSRNQYKMIAPKAQELQTFEGFGRGAVPLEIQEITGMRPVLIGDLSLNLNLSEQLDTPFLGNKATSAPARAKVLDKLAGTEEISLAGKVVDADLRRRGQDEKRLKVELADTEEKIAGYNWLPGYEQRIRRLEGLAVKIKAAQERRYKLMVQREFLSDYQKKIDAVKVVLERCKFVDIAAAWVSEAEAHMKRKQELEHKRDRMTTLDDLIADCQGRIDAWQGLDEAEKVVIAAQGKVERRKLADYYKHHMAAVQEAVQETQSTLARLEGLNAAEALASRAEALSAKKAALASQYLLLKNINAEIFKAENVMLRWAGVGEAESFHGKVAELMARRICVASMKKLLPERVASVTGAREQIVLWENRVHELEGAYQDELVNLGVCPVCGSEIAAKKLKEAI